MAASKVRIEVGFVSIAARMEKATDDEDSTFRTVCLGTDGNTHDVTRVKMHVICPGCGRDHSSVYGYGDRAVEVGDDLRVVTRDEIAAASGAPIKSMTLKFHSREKVYASTLPSDSVQNLSPDKGGEKAYTALVETLRARPNVVATTIYAPRTKNALWVLEVVENRLVATKRCWPEDVRATAAVTPAEVSDTEVAMFGQLIDATVSDFDLGEYVDQRRVGVKALVDSAENTTLATVTKLPTNTDFFTSLEASLAAAQPVKPAKKVAAKKATPRKRAAKKTAAASTARKAS